MKSKQHRIKVVSVNQIHGGRVPSVGSNESGGVPPSSVVTESIASEKY